MLLSVEERAEQCFGQYPAFSMGSYLSFRDNIRTPELRLGQPMTYGYRKFVDQPDQPGSYCSDMDDFMVLVGATDQELCVQFGDARLKHDQPVFVKTRPIGARNGIVVNLDAARHWNLRHYIRHDVPWADKTGDVVWRGATTGGNHSGTKRMTLVQKYAGILDVAFSHRTRRQQSVPDALVRGRLSPRDQLRHKYILSIEGNDVATGLKWILASNSVPIMPLPTVESWLLESQLKPFVHFVPVDDDFGNLLEALDWCRSNDAACQEIAHNGKRLIAQFTPESQAAVYRALYERFRALMDGA